MNIQIILGSVRQGRIADQLGAWVRERLAQRGGHTVDLIDLREWPLPPDDEPGIPAYGHYVQPHTLAWSRKIQQGDAYIFLVPQYNWGYPAPLKNALDHLYTEWQNKPAAIVSYANRGGGKAAAQLGQVLEGLHMRQTAEHAEVQLKELTYDEHKRIVHPMQSLAVFEADLDTVLDQLLALETTVA